MTAATLATHAAACADRLSVDPYGCLGCSDETEEQA